MKNIAIILAAGHGTRMGTEIRKQFLEVNGYPIIYYSLYTFQQNKNIDEIILVTSTDCIEYCREGIVNKYNLTKVKQVIAGGNERYDSVYAGLCACEACENVLIHDGARPFITDEIINRGIEGVLKYKACVIGMPSKDTIKIVDENGYIETTPSRDKVWNIQTPQIFKYQLIKDSYDKIRENSMLGITDDAMVVEAVNPCKIKLIEGSYMNIKITTPEDLTASEKFFKKLSKNY